MKKEQLLKSISERFGDRNAKRVEIISYEKFGGKEKLILKFYQSILDGFTSIGDIWANDDVINDVKKRIDSATEEDREKILLEILDTYDVNIPEVKLMLQKYKRVFKQLK